MCIDRTLKLKKNPTHCSNVCNDFQIALLQCFINTYKHISNAEVTKGTNELSDKYLTKTSLRDGARSIILKNIVIKI